LKNRVPFRMYVAFVQGISLKIPYFELSAHAYSDESFVAICNNEGHFKCRTSTFLVIPQFLLEVIPWYSTRNNPCTCPTNVVRFDAIG